jgi:hypothetical protein
MNCRKCKEDKPDTEFQTYFHSTQNVYRTRRQCNQCFNYVKKQLHLSKKMKVCIECGENKLKTEFYNLRSLGPNDRRHNICKVCTRAYEKRTRTKHSSREDRGEPVHWRPNTYNSIEQKDLAFELMEALGFTFQPDTGRWHKDGFKNPDGTFVHIEEKKRFEQERRLKEIEDLDIWSKVSYLRERGTTINQISIDTGVNLTAIYKFLQYGKKVELRS